MRASPSAGILRWAQSQLKVSKIFMMTYSVLEIKWKYQTTFKCCYNYNNT